MIAKYPITWFKYKIIQTMNTVVLKINDTNQIITKINMFQKIKKKSNFKNIINYLKIFVYEITKLYLKKRRFFHKRNSNIT